MKKTVYIIGHRNPDTDSVASAYAKLKEAQGFDNYRAARAGNISPQTEYIFERFKAPVPEYLPDLIPKARHYLYEKPETVYEDASIWEALEKLQRDGQRVLPIVDGNGVYKSMLHYRGFARYIIANITPPKKSEFPVSVSHLADTIHARRPLFIFNGEELLNSPIVVAASYNEYLTLQSATVTPTDRETAAYLSSVCGLDIKALGQELQSAANQVIGRPAKELVGLDMKEYAEQGFRFSVSQIETDNPAGLSARKEEIFEALDSVARSGDYLFSALMVTDVTMLDSLLFVRGKRSFTGHISLPQAEEGVYVLKDVVSRKKQLIPLLSELVEKEAAR
jgi:inorganic pyrophosphatase/exopolyphosphatase